MLGVSLAITPLTSRAAASGERWTWPLARPFDRSSQLIGVRILELDLRQLLVDCLGS